MRRAALLVGLLGFLATPPRAAAQDSTAAILRRALEHYEQLDLERALPLLRQVVSPGWTPAVNVAQRVQAYTYLAAALVLVGQADSATAYFGAALARDPFTDLDPREFTPAQLAAFGAARRLVFGVGVRPVAPTRADVRVERIRFTVATTHTADLTVLLQPVAGGAPFPIFSGENQGVRDVSWDGLMPGERLATPGRYALLAVAQSRAAGRTDTARVFLNAAYEMVTLEDTLPDLARRVLLPEYRTASGAGRELLKGAAVAAGALLASSALAHHELDRGPGGGALVAGMAIAVGIGGVLFVRSKREPIPENVAINRRTEDERRGRNEVIRRRNADRLAQTILLVTPAAGVGP